MSLSYCVRGFQLWSRVTAAPSMAVYASGANPSMGPITCLCYQGPTGVASSGAELARFPLESLPPFYRTASPAHTSSTGCTLPGTPWAVLTTPHALWNPICLLRC